MAKVQGWAMSWLDAVFTDCKAISKDLLVKFQQSGQLGVQEW